MRLLIVEDNAELSRLVANGPPAAGYESDIVASTEETREAVHDISYAAMILDLGLPHGDGLSVLRELRRQMEPLPVLVLTARGGLQDRVNGPRSGADDYLAKPFAIEGDVCIGRSRKILSQLVGTGVLNRAYEP